MILTVNGIRHEVQEGMRTLLEVLRDDLGLVGAKETGVLTATLDINAAKRHRAAFGFFRDRRPELYGRLAQDI